MSQPSTVSPISNGALVLRYSAFLIGGVIVLNIAFLVLESYLKQSPGSTGALGLILIGYWRESDRDRGLTGEIALFLTLLLGALACELSRGCSLEEAVRFATATSAVSVQSLGAQSSYRPRAEVEAFISSRS